MRFTLEELEVHLKKLEENLKESKEPMKGFLLDLSFQEISDEEAVSIAAVLKKYSWVKEINLFGNEIGDLGAQAFAGLEFLEGIDLEQNNITSEGARFIIKGVNLLRLNLGNNYIDDELFDDKDVSFFESHSKIEQLDLARNSIGDITIKTVASFPQLKILNVSFNQVSDKGIEYLERCKGLHTLDVSFNKLEEAAVQKLESQVKSESSPLTKVDVRFNKPSRTEQLSVSGIFKSSSKKRERDHKQDKDEVPPPPSKRARLEKIAFPPNKVSAAPKR